MGSKAPQENPNPGARRVVMPPPPPRKRNDFERECKLPSTIEINGFTFTKDEIVLVTIKRGGVEQTIYAPKNGDEPKIGFRV